MKHVSKRFFLCMLLASLCCLTAACSKSDGREETTEPVSEYTADFYRIEDEGKTLSLELDADPGSGYNWTYKISDERILNLSSFVFNPGDENGEGAVWSASFAALPEKNGNVKLSLYLVEKLEDVESAQPEYVLDLNVSVDGKISVVSITR